MRGNPYLSRAVKLKALNAAVEAYFELAYVRCSPLFVHTMEHPAEAILQEVGLGYLDLAVASPTHVNWRKRARSLIHSNLPRECVEFYLAETGAERFADEKFDRIWRRVTTYNRKLLNPFFGRLWDFRCSLFFVFESRVLQKFDDACDDHKKEMIWNYLAVYRSTPVDRFPSTFSSLLRMCTCPPLDCALTVELVRTFCVSSHKKFRVFDSAPNIASLQVLLWQARVQKFDFWGLWNGRGALSSGFDYVPRFMIMNMDLYSIILLIYGFPYMTGPSEYRRRCDRLLNTRFVEGNVIRSVDVFMRHEHTSQRTRMMLIMDTFLVFSKFRRVNEFCIQTIKYLNRTLPLPYVTPFELYHTMMLAVAPHFQQELPHIVTRYAHSKIIEDEDIVNSYDTIEDQDIVKWKPRCLVHLCRVAVRKILVDNFSLPKGIQRLPIPEELKKYLVLEN